MVFKDSSNWVLRTYAIEMFLLPFTLISIIVDSILIMIKLMIIIKWMKIRWDIKDLITMNSERFNKWNKVLTYLRILLIHLPLLFMDTLKSRRESYWCWWAVLIRKQEKESILEEILMYVLLVIPPLLSLSFWNSLVSWSQDQSIPQVRPLQQLVLQPQSIEI